MNRTSEYQVYLRKWITLSVIIGIIVGFASLCFFHMLKYLEYFLLKSGLGYSGWSVERKYLLFLIPPLGGLLSGFIVYKFAPETEGHGTDAVISSFHKMKGIIRRRVPIVKAIASTLIIGSGGSAGREGPIAQIGAAIGSLSSSLLKLKEEDRRIMLVCGTAAGIGSIFKAPLGGAVFSVEVLYRRDFETDALIPSFVSSIVAYSIFSSFPGLGFGPVLKVPRYEFHHPQLLFFYAVLGILLGGMSIIYVRLFYFLKSGFKWLRIPNWIKPGLGGLLLGTLAFFTPSVLGTGYEVLQTAINGEMMTRDLLLLGLAKMLATGFTIGSGGSGGVFAPSLFIGGMLGGAFGKLLSTQFEYIEPGAFALVGMASFFSGAAKVPVASLIIVSEMTGDYQLLAPLMLSCALAYITSSERWSIYESQVSTRAQSPAHIKEYEFFVLERLKRNRGG